MSPRELVIIIFDIINLLILARILMSWLPMAGVNLDPYNPIVRYLVQITDIFLEPFRRIIPPIGGMDISPIIAILVLQLVQQLVISLLPY
ncbi:MAG TPA: YggT family protein [Ardenticatenaceae bacterium]|jgi:YggT family protein